jgi:precorrin-6A/cobalt-precorrin-6A reductase
VNPPVRRLLILGGTEDARALADLVSARLGSRVEVTTSLAGRTRRPVRVAGAVRSGGFGGAAGLASFLREARIDMVVDATHPFATAITAHAREAAADAGVKRLVLLRPTWTPVPGDRWIDVADAREAASALRPFARRVFLSIGSRDLAAFAGLEDTWFLVRRIDPADTPLPLADYALTLGRGPFTREAERALLQQHRIDALVTRASGGAATRAKLDAARDLALPVVMIRRPPSAPGPHVATAEAALEWIMAQCGAGVDGAPSGLA